MKGFIAKVQNIERCLVFEEKQEQKKGTLRFPFCGLVPTLGSEF